MTVITREKEPGGISTSSPDAQLSPEAKRRRCNIFGSGLSVTPDFPGVSPGLWFNPDTGEYELLKNGNNSR